MKLKLITILLLLTWFSGLAQKDPAATTILDSFSEKALSSPSVMMEFKLTIHDRVEQSQQEQNGEVIIKGNKYKLTLPENIIWYDESATWTLAPEVKEVTVTLPDLENNTFLTSPSSLFDMYKEDFKYRLVSKNEQGSVIDLYPADPTDTDFSIIRLIINDMSNLISAEYKRKDGIDLYITVKQYITNRTFSDEYFSFDNSDYPDVDIIDMR